jgi:transposase
MLRLQEQLQLSEYSSLYDLVVDKNHLLRKIKDNIDFSFVNPMLKESYCENFGRPAKEPEMMFKLEFLKKLYDLSDYALIRDVKVNMAYKYFLGMNPEDEPPDPSLLTKFRKLRITEDILKDMLSQTVYQAIDKGLIKSRMIIVDATHSKASAKHQTPTQVLRKMTKELRKELYKTQFELSGKFPDKPAETADLSDEIEYSKKLIEAIRNEVMEVGSYKAKKSLSKISELLKSDKIKEIQSLADKDAKLGYKSETNSFFGYKTHIAMTEERIITGLDVTTGEAADGKHLEKIVEQSKDNGIKVEEVCGDTAYSSKDNLEYTKQNEIKLISKLNPSVSNISDKKDTGFIFNKDADTYQCPAGHLSIRAAKASRKSDGNRNPKIVYFFDIEKCKRCPFREGCYKNETNFKTHNVVIQSDIHKEQKEFQETNYFKERAKQRYMIEGKNAEMKQAHGLGEADSRGLVAMQLQSYFTAFVVNIKRIVKLLEPKAAKATAFFMT